jgi:hypothetical protein
VKAGSPSNLPPSSLSSSSSDLPLLPPMIRRCLAVSSTAVLASSTATTSELDSTVSGPSPAQQLQTLTSLLDSLFSGKAPPTSFLNGHDFAASGKADIMSPFSRPTVEQSKFMSDAQQVRMLCAFDLMIYF